MPHENITVQGYLAVVKGGSVETSAETFANIVSVLYFKKVVPERWAQFANSLAALRTDLAKTWLKHNTSAVLHNVIVVGANKPAGRSLFEAAFELRRSNDPAGVQKAD